MSRWKKYKESEIWSSFPPTVDDDPDELEKRLISYSVTSPDAFVVSGPLPGGKGPGRRMPSQRGALEWALERYGGWSRGGSKGVMCLVREAAPGGRWAVRVRAGNGGTP